MVDASIIGRVKSSFHPDPTRPGRPVLNCQGHLSRAAARRSLAGAAECGGAGRGGAGLDGRVLCCDCAVYAWSRALLALTSFRVRARAGARPVRALSGARTVDTAGQDGVCPSRHSLPPPATPRPACLLLVSTPACHAGVPVNCPLSAQSSALALNCRSNILMY